MDETYYRKGQSCMKILITGGTRFTGPFIVSTEKIRREPGYREIVSFEEGLRRTVAWERENQVIL